MMTLAGIILIIIALFIISLRAKFALFGKTAEGTIIGYGSAINGMRGAVSYSYKVEYEYNGKTYIAKAMENVTTFKNNIPNKNLNRKVTVCFDTKKPELVSIKEFNSITTIGYIILAFGIAAILV